MSGLVCSSMDVFKCLEGLQELKNLYTAQWEAGIGNNSTEVDFRNTGLINAFIRRNKSKYIFSN